MSDAKECVFQKKLEALEAEWEADGGHQGRVSGELAMYRKTGRYLNRQYTSVDALRDAGDALLDECRDICFREGGREPPADVVEAIEEKMKAAPSAVTTGPKGGRPEKFAWSTFDWEIVRLANENPDGLPDPDELGKIMREWISINFPEQPESSQVRARLASLHKYLRQPRQTK